MGINILLVYGEGGHHDQAMRLLSRMREMDPKLCFIHVTDSVMAESAAIGAVYVVPPMRHKDVAFSFVWFIKAYFKAACIAAKLVHHYRPRAVIGLGPGICIPVFMVCQLMGVKKRIFFEDWCRFSSKSLSGKVCFLFSTKFFVQNKSLQELYPYAEFAGRL